MNTALRPRHGTRSPTIRFAYACLIAGLMALPGLAAGRDLHRLWHDRCFECHGHSAEFARKFLSEVDGRLTGRHHDDDLRSFLHNHYLAGNDVDGVYRMLLAQTRTPPRFASECRHCHGSAADFVRQSLVRTPNGLIGRASKQPLGVFLAAHNGLAADDAEFFADTLGRVADEVFGPADDSAGRQR